MTGQPREIRWSWQSNDTDLRVGYMAVDGRMSITDLVEYMATVAPGVHPADIHINWSTVTWTRPATEEELAQRQAALASHNARQEAWERKTLARLLAKYGDPAAPKPPPDTSWLSMERINGPIG
jgi:hypothetical protein